MRGIAVLIAGAVFLSLCHAASADFDGDVTAAIYQCLNIPPWQDVQRGVVHVCTGREAHILYDRLVRDFGYRDYWASVINDEDHTRRPFAKLRGVNTDTGRTYCYHQIYYLHNDTGTTESWSCFYRLERGNTPRPDDNDEDGNMPASWGVIKK
jgi:hypothetical protein